jgi:hypothetical protein
MLYLLLLIAEAAQKQKSQMRNRRERRWEELMSQISSIEGFGTKRAIDNIKTVWRVL